MADADIAYKHFRVYITKAGSSGFSIIDQIKLYEQISQDAINLVNAQSATATASSTYPANGGNLASLPVNVLSDNGKYWEPATATVPCWLTISFQTAKAVRVFEMINSTTYPIETPASYKLQGSNDNTVWTDLYTNVDTLQPTLKVPLYLMVLGKSTLDNNSRSSRVLVYDWNSAALIKSITPDNDGSWACNLLTSNEVFVTHLGPSGYPPITTLNME